MEKGISGARLALLAAAGGLAALWAQPSRAEVPVPRISPLSAFAPASLGAAETAVADLPLPARIERELTVDVSRSVAEFYAGRDFAPLWNAATATALRARLAAADGDGLDPADYRVPAGLSRAAEDVSLTEAALRFARDAYSGRVAPQEVSRIIDLEPPRLNEARFLQRLAAGEDLSALFDWVQPHHPQYRALREALRRVLKDGAEQPPMVGPGPNLRLGDSEPRVAALRTRLEPDTASDAADLFDESLDAAVKAFQREHGLRPDGIVGPRTLALLDGTPDAADVASLVSNMERWRWMPRWLGRHTVVVNIPAYTVTVAVDGTTTYEGRVVVGSPDRPTPVLASMIDHIVVNPYWNVPVSIATNEMLGGIRANPAGYFARHNYEAVLNGKVVSPASIDWSGNAVRRVRIRQKPGRGNALGSIKFLFDNPFSVYLHDTPSKSLFARDTRAFSHGCVRVDQPFDFADALLSEEASLTGKSLARMVGGDQRWLTLKPEVPVYLAYFTRTVRDGGVVAYGDVYGFDARTQRALGL